MNSVTASHTSVGLVIAAAPFSDGNYLSLDDNSLTWVCSSGTVGTASPLGTWATYASGANLFFALDYEAKLFWGKVETSGNWNNSGTANPATGTGGTDISSLFAGALFPAVNLYTLSTDKATCNFSPTEAAPSGFAVIGGGPVGQGGAAGHGKAQLAGTVALVAYG